MPSTMTRHCCTPLQSPHWNQEEESQNPQDGTATIVQHGEQPQQATLERIMNRLQPVVAQQDASSLLDAFCPRSDNRNGTAASHHYSPGNGHTCSIPDMPPPTASGDMTSFEVSYHNNGRNRNAYSDYHGQHVDAPSNGAETTQKLQDLLVQTVAQEMQDQLQTLRNETVQELEMLRHECATLKHQLATTTEELTLFKNLVESAPDAITLTDVEDSTFVYMNPSARRMTGYDDMDEGIPVQQAFTPESADKVEEATTQSLERGSWRGTVTYRRLDGSTFEGQLSTFVLHDGDDQPRYLGGIVRDISQQLWMEQELRTFYSLIDNAPDGIVVTSLSGTLTYANPSFRSMFGYGERSVGMAIPSFVSQAASEKLVTMSQQLMQHGVWQGTLECCRKDGSTFPGDVSFYLLRNRQGKPNSLVGFYSDITSLKQEQEERAALQEQLIHAQQVAIRELSTPLLPIADTLVVMPLIGRMDKERARAVTETLLKGVAREKALFAILDITGMQEVDSQVAEMLVNAARGVQMLGAQAILTGVRPEIARTLVLQGGIDLNHIKTFSTLQKGIASVLP